MLKYMASYSRLLSKKREKNMKTELKEKKKYKGGLINNLVVCGEGGGEIRGNSKQGR